MSRRFALALIAVVLVQYFAVYAWQRSEHRAEMTMTADQFIATTELAVDRQEESLNFRVESYRELMRDDSKARFAPLVKFVADQHTAYQKFAKTEFEPGILYRAEEFINNLVLGYTDNLLAEHLTMDFKLEDATTKCRKIRMAANEALTRIADIPTTLQPEAKAVMTRAITLAYTEDVLTDVMSFACVRGLIIDSYFPVFNADRCAYQRGDTLNARISVGSYSNSLNPENVTLTVDGLEYPIGPDGTAKFQTTERKRGQHTLKTRVEVSNPLTGEVKVGEGSFTYEVY